jgi:hypothetical protein
MYAPAHAGSVAGPIGPGRLIGLTPIATAEVETVRFDVSLLASPGISGVEYQQGELCGYEVREYLLEKCQHLRLLRKARPALAG